MKNTTTRIIAFGIILSLFICSARATCSFPDVTDTEDYTEAIEVLSDMGIMVGDSNGNFNPDKAVTRAEMAAIICRTLGEEDTEPPADSTLHFSDVTDSFWAKKYILNAASLKIIAGYEDGTFHPNDTVTYAQALTMVVRTMGLEDMAVSAGGYPDGYIAVAEEKRLTGDIAATSDDLLTRWQVAKIIFSIFT